MPRKAETFVLSRGPVKSNQSVGLAALKHETQKLEQQGRKRGRPASDIKKIRMNFLCTEEFVDRLRAFAFAEQKTITDVIIDAVTKAMDAKKLNVDIALSVQKN